MPWYILVIVLWLLSGCIQGYVTMVEPRSYPPSASLEILREKPARPYTTFAMVRATSTPSAEDCELVAVLQKEARAIGADAIILLPREENERAGGYNPCAGGVIGGGGEKISVLKALAIKYE